MYVALEDNGRFSVMTDDAAEVQSETGYSAKELVGSFFDSDPDEYLSNLRDAVLGLVGFEEVVRLIDDHFDGSPPD